MSQRKVIAQIKAALEHGESPYQKVRHRLLKDAADVIEEQEKAFLSCSHERMRIAQDRQQLRAALARIEENECPCGDIARAALRGEPL